MITIIKKGEDPKEKPKTIKCQNCRTYFSYTAEDTHTDRDGMYVICPVCGKFLSTTK